MAGQARQSGTWLLAKDSILNVILAFSRHLSQLKSGSFVDCFDYIRELRISQSDVDWAARATVEMSKIRVAALFGFCFNILTFGQFKVQSWWNHSWIGKYLLNKWSNDTSRWKTQVRSQESFATWYLAASCFLGKCIEIQEPGLTAANNRTGRFSSTLEMNRAGQMSVCMM